MHVLIIDSRLGYHFIPDSFKIYLTAKPEVIASRTHSDHRESESFKTKEEAQKLLMDRMNVEKTKYIKFYGTDPTDMSNYDIVVDTSEIKPNKVVEKILDTIDN